jgi:hypothetical protein
MGNMITVRLKPEATVHNPAEAGHYVVIVIESFS